MQSLLLQYSQLTTKFFYWSNIGEITDFGNTLWYVVVAKHMWNLLLPQYWQLLLKSAIKPKLEN